MDGFTITGGSNGISINTSTVYVKNNIIRNNNRGINAFNSSNVLTIEDTIIRNNTGDLSGAGMYIKGGGPHSITGCTIKDNTANYNDLVPGSGNGGGLFIQNGSLGLTITDSILSGNYADQYGGGIYLNNSSITINRAIINLNTSDVAGGGLSLQGTGSTSLINCNVVDNTAPAVGGGIYMNNHAVNITNSTVSGNNLTDKIAGIGGGLYSNGNTVQIKNSIFWANAAGGLGSGHECFTLNGTIIFRYSDLPNNLNALAESGSGVYDADLTNIDADPLFVDRINGDYRLKSISPAINTGTSTGAPADDIDGDSRPQPSGGDYDMGADEYIP